MLRIIRSNRFEKDLKLAIRRGCDLQPLKLVVDILVAGQPLPARYRDHALLGEYTGFRECHVKSDWLLIYRIDAEDLELFLLRIGSHSDLFV